MIFQMGNDLTNVFISFLAVLKRVTWRRGIKTLFPYPLFPQFMQVQLGTQEEANWFGKPSS